MDGTNQIEARKTRADTETEETLDTEAGAKTDPSTDLFMLVNKKYFGRSYNAVFLFAFSPSMVPIKFFQ